MPYDQLARLLLALACFLVLAAGRWAPAARLLALPRAATLIVVATVAGKLLGCLLLYEVLGLAPPSDLPGFYVPWATAFAEGALPYRDVPYQFQPYFFLYLTGPWLIWPDARVFVLLAILCHAVALAALLAFSRRRLAPLETSQLLLVLALDPLLTGHVLMGQDEAFMLMLIALALLALQRARPLLAGVALAGLVLATKALSLLIAGALALTGWRVALALAGLVAAGYGLVLALGLDPLTPVTASLGPREDISPGNLPFALTLLGLPLHANLRLYDGLLAAALLALAAWGWQQRPRGAATAEARLDWAGAGAAILLLAWMLLARKSWYEILLAPLLPLLLARWLPFIGGLALWCLLSLLASLDPSLWYEELGFATYDAAPAGAEVGLFASVDFALIAAKAALLAWLVTALRRQVRRRPET